MPSDLDRVWNRNRLKTAGVRLAPMYKSSGPREYLVCKVCGQDFGGVDDMGRYIDHIEREHPQYKRSSASIVYVDANGHLHRRSRKIRRRHLRCDDCGEGRRVEVYVQGSEPPGFIVDSLRSE